MKRRLLSLLTAFSMCAGFLPAGGIPVLAANGTENAAKTVEYNRMDVSPEFALLNATTGTDEKFYESLKTNYGTGNYYYNTVILFGADYSGSQVIGTDGRNLLEYNLHGKKFSELDLVKLIQATGDIDVSFSSTMTSYNHQHKANGYKIQVTGYESASLTFMGNTAVTLNGYQGVTEKGSARRVGDNEFHKVTYNADKADDNGSTYISFYPTEVWYRCGGYLQACTCAQSKADGFLIVYRDAETPTVRSISYSTDGINWSANTKTFRANGEKLYIKLSYDEPIRFADDSADGTYHWSVRDWSEDDKKKLENLKNKNSLYIQFLESGESEDANKDSNKAYLYKLDGNDLYFEYDIAKNTTVDGKAVGTVRQIASIGLKGLFGSDIPLVTWCDRTGHILQAPVEGGYKSGYNISDSYVTDIAGNSIDGEALINANLIVDTETPYVERVIFNVSANNANVKSDLTVDGVPKDQLDPDDYEDYSRYESDYLDDSDRFLGVGDSISFTLKMNEKLKLDTEWIDREMSGQHIKGYLLNWNYATATTNIKAPAGYTGTTDSDGYVTVKSTYYSPTQYKLNTMSGEATDVTTITMGGITLTEGMTVDDAKGEIKITKLTFDFSGASSDYQAQMAGYLNNGSVTDLTGNPLTHTNIAIGETANTNPYRLDVTPLKIGGSDYTPLGGEYTGTEKGFRYTVNLSLGSGEGAAGTDCSEFRGINGSFLLKNGGDGLEYEYEYLILPEPADTGELAQKSWKTGKIGVSAPFTQFDNVYFYIRPKAGEEYHDLRDCTLLITAADFAGTAVTKELPVTAEGGTSSFEWYIDTVAPTVTAGTATRALNGEGGTLTARVTLSDSHGISAWQYAWSDSDTEEPASWTEGGGLTEQSGNTVTVSAAVTVDKESLFSKYLWVKATDNADRKNVAVKCLGQYVYDLRKANYSLSYPTAFVTAAELQISELSAEDTLFFLVPAQQMNAGENSYLVLRVDGTSATKNENIFAMSGWKTYNAVSLENGKYTFGSPTSELYMTPFTDSTYAGNLEIIVLSGKTAGVSDSGTQAGNDSYDFSESRVTLKVTSKMPEKNYTYSFSEDTTPITLRGSETLKNTINNKDYWNGTQNVPEGSEKTVLNTLEGVPFTITVPADRYGWQCEDIDWQKSKLVLTNHTDLSTYEVGIKAFQVNTSGAGALAVQTVTVPAASCTGGSNSGVYTTGTYTAELLLKFKADGSYTLTVPYSDGYLSKSEFVVDATEVKGDFTIQSIGYGVSSMYNTNNYDIMDMDTVYEGGEYSANSDGIIYIPVSSGELVDQSKYSEASTYQITINCEGEEQAGTVDTTIGSGGTLSYIGLYVIKMWNEDEPDNVVTLKPDDDSQTVVTNTRNTVYFKATGFTVGDAEHAKASGLVNLTADTVNTVVLEKVYSNGKTVRSKVKIQPVTKHLNGSLRVNGTDKVLEFTPTAESAVNAVGARVYAFVYQNGVNFKNPTGSYELVAMTQQSNGIWTCPLAENGAKYRVFTVNSYGSVWVDERAYTTDRAPWFDTPSFTDNRDGTWTLNLTVYDDYGSMVGENWDDVTLAFAEGYSKTALRLGDIGLEKEAMSPYYVWSNGEEISPNGIYQVTVTEGNYDWGENEENYYDDLTIEVKGVFLSSSENMGLTVTAVDDTGNRKTEAVNDTVSYKTPKVVGQTLTSGGLVLTFDQPVMPTETWAWTESDDGDRLVDGVTYPKGYKTVWQGAFPILANGTHTITVRDVTGGVQTVEVEITAFTDADGNDWSVSLAQSETALTKEAVYLTAELKNRASDAAGIQLWDNDNHRIVPEGQYDGTETQSTMQYYDPHGNNGRFYGSHVSWSILNYYATSSPRTVKREENGAVWLEVYAKRYSEQVATSSKSLVFSQVIHIDNIANEAPEGEVIYYSDSLVRSFTYAQLAEYVAQYNDTLVGTLTATYETSRTVTPTGNTGTEFVFTPENYATAAHTFTYTDEMGNEGSVEAKLPTGVKLIEEQPVSTDDVKFAPDTTAPSVTVELYAKRGGSYTREESLTEHSTDTEIVEKFKELSYVQGYRFLITASDTSGCDIQVTGENGGALPAGITLTGNILTVERAGTVEITVTDRSENQNRTVVKIPAAAMSGWFDTTPPTAEISEERVSLYEKVLYITLRDNNGTVEPISPTDLTKVTDGEHSGAYRWAAKANETVTFVFRDAAGNRGEKSYTVQGIDLTAPKLTVTWSPAYSYVDYGTGETVTEPSMPTQNAVNSDVTAIISSDKTMRDLTVSINGVVTELLNNGKSVTNPYEILGQNGVLVTIYATAERITVTYHDCYEATMLFTATTPNGKTGMAELQAWLNIDKTAPTITETVTPLYRKDGTGNLYSVPYGARVTLEADEWVTSPNYGGYNSYTDPLTGETVKTPLEYESGEDALTFTVTENGSHKVRFVDYAGNVTVHTVRVNEPIDKTAPKLTVGERDESNNQVTVTVTVNEACALTVAGKTYQMTAGVSKILTFTDNGSYLLNAIDNAGNEATAVVTVGTIDKILPTISFDTNTVYLIEGNATAEELREKLDRGYTLWDNVTAESVLRAGCVIDTSAVQLNMSGQYTVTYTVTDEAGNSVTVNRFVEIIGKDTVCVVVDGALIVPNGTAVLEKGTHRISLVNTDEVYTVRARQGIFGIGQMKYTSKSSLTFDENGSFAVNGSGYYTLLVTTQSRKTIRILLYIAE